MIKLDQNQEKYFAESYIERSEIGIYVKQKTGYSGLTVFTDWQFDSLFLKLRSIENNGLQMLSNNLTSSVKTAKKSYKRQITAVKIQYIISRQDAMSNSVSCPYI